jgi:hypothetical protein
MMVASRIVRRTAVFVPAWVSPLTPELLLDN